jgi:Ca2+-binding RTX toxin-like protein
LSPGNHTITATETSPAGTTSDPSSPLDLIVAPSATGPNAPNEVFYTDPSSALVLGTSGDDTIIGNASNQTIDGLGGDDNLTANGNNDNVAGGARNDTISATGNNDTVIGGSGNNRLETTGSGNLIIGGDSGDVIWSLGRNSAVSAGSGDDFMGVLAGGDTIDGGGGNNVIFLLASNVTLTDGSAVHHDTVIGFEPPNGDTIHLTTDTPTNALAHSSLINNGQDTEIALSDGSTIVLRGIASIDTAFFSERQDSPRPNALHLPEISGGRSCIAAPTAC